MRGDKTMSRSSDSRHGISQQSMRSECREGDRQIAFRCVRPEPTQSHDFPDQVLRLAVAAVLIFVCAVCVKALYL